MQDKILVVIVDTVADDFVGPPAFFNAEPPAIRWFIDIATSKETGVNKHLADHELRQLGEISEGHIVTSKEKTLITGQQVMEMQAAQRQLSLGE